ncbi:zinc finger domain-containing protein [Nonomuraea sp. SYSU D8015]|uniref:zinc finger domain-containing protein n=1 Tax=Nonomuraea sp. SYSU D8015 TaxID=2593644 RepID=UPI001660FC87|nr:hypothetical protein [Nonomuraea sp. SYSU D8015]
MGTIRVKNQAARYERAEVMCPEPKCGAVKDQPCKQRTRYRVVIREKIHPSRRQKQAELDAQRAGESG